jgi:WD40 repeat protein
MSREDFSPKPRVFISYARRDGEAFATALRTRLKTQEPEIPVWQDRAEMEGGVGWWRQIEEALEQVRFLVIVMTPAAMRSEMTRKEWRYARRSGVNVYPVKGGQDAELDYAILPKWMAKAHFFDLDKEWETFVNFLKSDREPKRVAFMAPDLPEGFIQRPRKLEQLIAQLVDAKRENPVAITSALQGAGGYGKTTLAIAVCHDNRVLDAFDDGILWVTLGQNPNVLAELTKLYKALTGDQPTFVDDQDAELHLREKLENRNCLLVIDDVWLGSRLKPFLQGGKKTCARLITTRRLDLVIDASPVHVDEMAPEEAVALLATRIPRAMKPRDLQPFYHLAAQLMEWPLLLKLAAGVIGARLKRNDTLGGALDYTSRAYEKRGLTAFDPKDAQERNDAVAKSIQTSLELLNRDERTRLNELAIFPEDTDVPLRIVELLWGLDNMDTQDTATCLADFALLDFDLSASIVRLHDEIRLYLGRASMDQAALHAKLIDRLGNPKRIRDRYALRWLPWHLGKAGRDTERRALLFDFEWLLAKLEGTDIQSLIADYDYMAKDADLEVLQSVLRRSAHILAANPRELPGQLLGRLIPNLRQDIDGLRTRASEHKSFPWLRPLSPSLTPLDASFVRTPEGGHTARVTAVALTSDGHRVVSGSSDNTLRLWDLASGQTLRTLQGHTAGVNAVVLTADGRRLVSASWDNTLRVWDLESGQTLRTLEGHVARVNAVALTPDGRRVVSGSWDNTLRVWDLESGQTLKTLQGHLSSVSAVAISHDGGRVVSGSWDNTLRVWDVESGQTLRILQGHTHWVNAVTANRDGRRVVSGSSDNTLRVWDLESGGTIMTLQGHTARVNAVALTPDGRRVVSASSDNTLRVWDLESGGTIMTLQGHINSVYAVALTPDGRNLVSGSSDNTLRVWELESAQTLRTLEGYTNSVSAVALTSDGRRVVSGSWDNTLCVWDMESGQTLRMLHGHTHWVNAVALTPDGRRVVSGSSDSTLRVWDLESGQTFRILQGHTGRVNAVALTPGGRRVVSGSSDSTLRVWDLESGQTLRILQGHTGRVNAVALTPDGRRLVSGASDDTLRIWDLESGQILKTLQGHIAGVSAVALTSDGRCVVSGSWDNTLRVWDLESGQTLRTLQGHTTGVNTVVLTHDDRCIVSGSSDNTLRVWGFKDGNELVTFTLDGTVTACSVAQDNRIFVAGDGFGRLHFLRLQVEDDYSTCSLV